MNRVSLCFFSLLALTLSLTLMGSGCGGTKKPAETGGGSTDKSSDEGSVPAEVKTTPLKAGDGVITGTVVFDGEDPGCKPPAGNLLTTAGCVAKGKEGFMNCDQKWIVFGDKKLVANVLVVLKPPADHAFQKGKHTGKVVLEQPFCAFVPHVLSIKPGETLLVKNNATIPHDTKVKGDPLKNPPRGGALPVDAEATFEIKPQKEPLSVSCTNHSWMQAVIWAFDHPYSAVTDDNGHFKIEGVPTGVKLTVSAWHEGVGFFKNEEVKLDPKETKTIDFKVKPK